MTTSMSSRSARFPPSALASVSGWSMPRRLAREELADGQLVTLALNGDRRAFPVLMARYEPGLRRLVRRRVRHAEDAADLTQETLLSAWAALQTYSPQHPFRSWLFGIALNKCRDWGRRRAVRARAAAYLSDLLPEPPPAADNRIIDDETGRAFLAALADLPDPLRRPLTLTALDGLSQREAADRLGLTVKGVETRVRRARLALRDTLEPKLAG